MKVSCVYVLQALLTDMAAHSHVINDINGMAEEMIANNHGKTAAVKKRRAEINDKYNSRLILVYCSLIIP